MQLPELENEALENVIKWGIFHLKKKSKNPKICDLGSQGMTP
jgi:hypothetical protein